MVEGERPSSRPVRAVRARESSYTLVESRVRTSYRKFSRSLSARAAARPHPHAPIMRFLPPVTEPYAGCFVRTAGSGVSFRRSWNSWIAASTHRLPRAGRDEGRFSFGYGVRGPCVNPATCVFHIRRACLRALGATTDVRRHAPGW